MSYDDPTRQAAEEALTLVNAANADLHELQPFSVPVARKTMEICSEDFGVLTDPTINQATQPAPFDRGTFDEALSVLNKVADAQETNFISRRRPNIFLGVFLILMGFAAQAFASMPIYAQQSVLDGFLRTIGAPPLASRSQSNLSSPAQIVISVKTRA